MNNEWEEETVKPREEWVSAKNEPLVDRVKKEQSKEATDAFMQLVIGICDEVEVDETLKKLVNR